MNAHSLMLHKGEQMRWVFFDCFTCGNDSIVFVLGISPSLSSTLLAGLTTSLTLEIKLVQNQSENLSERCDNLVLQRCSACICVMLPSQWRLLAGPENVCKFEFLQDVDRWGITVVLKSTRFICKCQEHEQTLCRSCNCQKRAFAHLSRNSQRSLVDQVRTVGFGLFPY